MDFIRRLELITSDPKVCIMLDWELSTVSMMVQLSRVHNSSAGYYHWRCCVRSWCFLSQRLLNRLQGNASYLDHNCKCQRKFGYGQAWPFKTHTQQEHPEKHPNATSTRWSCRARFCIFVCSCVKRWTCVCVWMWAPARYSAVFFN